MAVGWVHGGWTVHRRQTKRHPWSRRRTIKTVAACTVLTLLSTLAAFAIYVASLIVRVGHTLPDVRTIAAFRPAEPTRILSSDGVLLATLQMENRRVVKLDQMSPWLIKATLAAEDDRFYQHHGLDYRGIARAAFADLLHRGAAVEGGSTITQQVARNVPAFKVSREKTLERKVREAMTAVRIEQALSKDDILELYLNQIYYGSGAYGAEAAARTYFGKPAAKLDIAEAALLAGLPQRPRDTSPFTDPDAARARRDVVLQRMCDTGRISRPQLDQARAEPIHLAARQSANHVLRAPYFVDWVVQGLTGKYGIDKLYSGWTIITTLNWKIQEHAEHALRGGLSYGATQGGLICLDPHTGEVRAMVGGVDYHANQFNVITQGRRQPGSAFKPILYAAALDTGAVALETQVKDEKKEYDIGARHPWVVHNYGGGYSNQPVTVLQAITHSINTVATEVGFTTGLDKVVNYAHMLGITADLHPYPSIALGSEAVRPIELCTAYGAFAANGERYTPAGVQLIRDANGEVVFRDDSSARETVSGLQAATIQSLDLALRSVVTSGTGTAASSVPNAFGKTGTTSDERDAWFVGFTPELVTAVWVARPEKDARGHVTFKPMYGATGGRAAAPIWALFMSSAVPIQKMVDAKRGQRYAIALPPPPQLTPPSAEESQPADQGPPSSAPSLGTPGYGYGAPQAYRPAQGGAVYATYTAPPAPRSSDDGVRLVRICADTGLLATEWCDTTVLVDGRGRLPRRYCPIHHAPPGE